MAGKAVIKTTLALVAKTFTGSATKIAALRTKIGAKVTTAAMTGVTTIAATHLTRTAKLALARRKITTATATAKGRTRFRHALLWLQARNNVGLDRLATIGLDIENTAAIAHFGKSHGNTITPRTTGTANTVGVVFGLHRQTKIKNVGNGGDVNTARSHIGGDQNLHLTLAQRHQSTIAQTLTQCAVQRDGIKTILLQVIG